FVSLEKSMFPTLLVASLPLTVSAQSPYKLANPAHVSLDRVPWSQPPCATARAGESRCRAEEEVMIRRASPPYRYLITLACLTLVLGATGSARAASELGIITGGERGTYYQFGLNLQRLGKQTGVDLSVATSKGSIEN